MIILIASQGGFRPILALYLATETTTVTDGNNVVCMAFVANVNRIILVRIVFIFVNVRFLLQKYSFIYRNEISIRCVCVNN